MKLTKEFPFERARRVTKQEVKEARKAIERLTGVKRRPRKGRPPKAVHDKYQPISIRLHPKALAWLKKEARRQAKPYQSIVNEIILRHSN